MTLPRCLTTALLVLACLLTVPLEAQTTAAATTRSYTPGGQWDPQLRAAHFEVSNGQYLDATRRLRNLADRTHGKPLSPQLQRLLADASLGFGLPAPAEHSYRELDAGASDTESLGKAQLDLAAQLYNHGDTKKAVALLHAVHSTLPGNLQARWNSLLGRALLRLNRVAEAITAFQHADSGPDAAYARYNLAVALLRSGHTDDGIKQLDHAGRTSVQDPDDLALRDRANVVLGYYYLRHEKAVKAVKVFSRVRMHGPYSNRALLGLGWAYMALSAETEVPRAPARQQAHDRDAHDWMPSLGVLMRPGFVNEAILKNRRVQLMRHLPPHAAIGKQGTRLRRALVPWSALLNRDPMDTAVQEGMVAVPYALDKVGAHQEALNYYEKAIAALEKTRHRIAAARKDIKSGRMVKTMIAANPAAQTGWNWRLIDLPDAVETFYLQRTIAEHPFQESLKNYRDLRLLKLTLKATDTRLSTLLTRPADAQRRHLPLQFVLNRAQQIGAPLPPVTHGTPVRLALSVHLGSAGLARASVGNRQPLQPPPSSPASGLGLAPLPPDGFHGAPQDMAAARTQIAALQPQIEAAMAGSSARLQKIALTALSTQDANAKKYLIQVRLAVARIYDNQSAGLGVVPATPTTVGTP